MVTRKSTTCYFLYHGSHLLESTAVDLQVVAVSSGEAEFYALGAGSAAALGVKELLQELGITVKVKVYCDSSAGRGIAKRIGSGRVKHLQTRFLWVQEKVRHRELEVAKVGSRDNRADLGTKYHSN